MGVALGAALKCLLWNGCARGIGHLLFHPIRHVPVMLINADFVHAIHLERRVVGWSLLDGLPGEGESLALKHFAGEICQSRAFTAPGPWVDM